MFIPQAELPARIGTKEILGPTIVVAAYDAPEIAKRRAKYVCSGINDHLTINRAIGDLPADPIGGCVELSSGHFIGGKIVPRGYIWLKGQGFGTNYKLANTTNDNILQPAIGQGLIIVSDMMFDGNKANQASGNGLVFDSANNSLLARLYITNVKQNAIQNADTNGVTSTMMMRDIYIFFPGSNGIYLNNVWGQYLNKIHISEAGLSGLHYYLAGESQISNIDCDECTEYGMRLQECTRVNVSSFRAGGNTLAGIYLLTANGVKLMGGDLHGNYDGTAHKEQLLITGSQKVSVLGCGFQYSTNAQNAIKFTGAVSDKIEIFGNTYDTNGDPEMVLDTMPTNSSIQITNPIGPVTHNIGESINKRKTADETVNNSAVLQNDDHLLFAIAANEVWLVEFFILYYCATNTVGIKFQCTAPAAATINRIIGYGYNTSEALAVMEAASELSFGEFNANIPAHFWVIVANGANAGNVQLQWAQAVAEVNDTKVLTNSYIIAHRLA